jgi:hypothetical protein
MFQYQDPSYASGFEAILGQDQDGSLGSSVPMGRTLTAESGSTSYTDISAHTCGTSYSADDGIPPKHGACQETPLWSASSFSDEHLDAIHMGSWVGSQPQQADNHLTQELASQWSFRTKSGREEAANHAAQSASWLIATGEEFYPSVITYEAVDHAVQYFQDQGFEEADRMGIQHVLYQQLYFRINNQDFDVDAMKSLALQEAAYQLQRRTQGQESVQICYYAIVTTLAQLMQDLGRPVEEDPDPAQGDVPGTNPSPIP